MNFDTILQQAQEKYKEKPTAKPEVKQKPIVKKEVQLSNLKQIKAQHPQK